MRWLIFFLLSAPIWAWLLVNLTGLKGWQQSKKLLAGSWLVTLVTLGLLVWYKI